MYGIVVIAVYNFFERFICLYVIGSQRLTLERDFKCFVDCRQIESRLVRGIVLERGIDLGSVRFELADKRHMKLTDMTAHRGDK